MKLHLPAAIICLALPNPLYAFEIKWPNAEIVVPPLVQTYIVAECQKYRGYSEESVGECINAERYGYRAVVMMLSEPVLGDRFAEQYRNCRVGVGDLGGRFHRRRAECMGCLMNYVWRFEYMQRADIDSALTVADGLHLGIA